MLAVRLRACLAPLLLAAGLPSALADGPAVDQLDQSALQEAFRLLKANYIRQDALSYEEINRAALDGLLRRLQAGAELVPPTPAAPAAADTPALEFHAELLPSNVGYLRFQTFAPAELAALDEWLEKFQAAESGQLILDLRVPCPQPDLEALARILDRFVNPNVILFKVQRLREERPRLHVSQVTSARWKGGLVVLIDSESACGAELLAAVLRKERSAFLVGSPTPGRTVEYEEAPLSDSVRLRFAVAEILLADGASLFRSGVQPHFAMPVDLAKKRQIFAASAHTPMATFVLDRARPRMNEAALVQETDPELDYHVARARGERTPYDQEPLQDRTLQRALDLITTVGLATATAGAEKTAQAGNPPPP